MKKSFLFPILILLSKTIYCQETIQWNFFNGDTSGSNSFKTNMTVHISRINNGDTIFFGAIPKKINCTVNNTVKLILKRIDTSVMVNYCNDSINIPFTDDRKVEFNKKNNESIRLILELNDQDPGIDFANGSVNKNSLNESNLYSDAFLLYQNKDTSVIQAILSKYDVDTTNKFLDSLLSKNPVRAVLDINALQAGALNNSVGGIGVTTLADGLAKFLVARVKKEMIISFFNNFSAAIQDTSARDLQILFKNTYGILDLMGEKIYDYQPYLASLRQNMEYDFKELPQALDQLITDSSSQLSTYLDKTRNQRFIASIALGLGTAIQEEQHIGKAIAELKTSEFTSKADKSLIASIQSLQVFSEAFRASDDMGGQSYWLDKSKINDLIHNDTLLRYFIGLVAQRVKEKNIELKPGQPLYTFLNINIGPKKVLDFKTLFNSLQIAFTKINAIDNKHLISPREDAKEISIVNYFEAAQDLFESSRHFADVFKLDSIKPTLTKLLDASADFNGLIKNVTIKKYTLASMHLANLVKNISTDNDSKFLRVVTFITQKSLFIGQLAEAKTSDEVAAIIESFAAPVGSWRDKRNTDFNVALDSYVGPAGFITSDNQRLALSTPVGVSFTFPVMKYPLSFLLSAVDIGPATAFRFKNDSSEVSKITLGEIFSPGIFTSINFGRSFPLTFNVGYQEYPLLKRVSNQFNEYIENRKGGLSISFSMNIPILTLFNKRTNEE